MGTSIKIDAPQENEIRYPKLMSTEAGRVVWMTSRGEGMALCSPYIFSSSWDMTQFTDFHGSVTLSNTEE